MNEPQQTSPYPRLDVLDAILSPEVSLEFLRFVRDSEPQLFLALVVIGAVECGVTPPRNWLDQRTVLERYGREGIEHYIDAQLEKRND